MGLLGGLAVKALLQHGTPGLPNKVDNACMAEAKHAQWFEDPLPFLHPSFCAAFSRNWVATVFPSHRPFRSGAFPPTLRRVTHLSIPPVAEALAAAALGPAEEANRCKHPSIHLCGFAR